MNRVMFACSECRVFIDAGYRWAFCELEEPGIVSKNEAVNVAAVLGARTYWAAPNDEESKWLTEKVLPAVKLFLEEHRNHHSLVYLDEDVIWCEESLYYSYREIDIGY